MEVSIVHAKARFSELIGRAERGEQVTITRRGRPIAGLVPIPISPLPLDRAFFEDVDRMPMQDQDAATLIRWMRDSDRY